MQSSLATRMLLTSDQCQRAARAHDPRFDGIFFIGVITTRIYCRPICPARVSVSSHRRFFVSAAAAERAGFRPCLRCRPELAPGRAPVDAVSRLAFAATVRIAAGALNGRSVADLARELGVSERHLRRSLEREVGVSPVELAQTHRLLLAKRLIADTALPVTEIAFASGFQSLRRFNTAFLERYRLSPSRLRRAAVVAGASPARDVLRLTLAYRAPYAWDALLQGLERDALPGVEIVEGARYGRTVSINGRSGVVFATDTALRVPSSHLDIEVSLSLLPVLMPLLARLRQLFDLDAEPSVIDAHLEQSGLAALVAQRRGLRVPGALDGFEAVLGELLGGAARRVVAALGEPIDTGVPGLDRLAPTAERVVAAGAAGLRALGVAPRRAGALAAAARAIADGQIALDPGSDVLAARQALLAIDGIGERAATQIVMRALYWPDAFPLSDRTLQQAAGAKGPGTLRAHAERWRPWRAYAAMHFRFQGAAAVEDSVSEKGEQSEEQGSTF